MNTSKDLYSILGVRPDAEAEIIRAVFVVLAKKHHPDSNGSPSDTHRFKEINQAYEVLNNPIKRKAYDEARSRIWQAKQSPIKPHSDDEQAKPIAPIGRGKIIASSCAVALLIALIFKVQIISVLPLSAILYDSVGLGGKPTGAGLEFQDVKSTRELDNDEEVLIVRGSITNTTNVGRKVPIVQISLLDNRGQEVQQIDAVTTNDDLAADHIAHFEARFSSPSPFAQRIETTFKTSN